jgi:mannose-6-phosphate isomerase-like protein (cupin superfamily)
MKTGFTADIETETIKNTDYRRVLYTARNTQLVLMRLRPGEEIGEEVHGNVDQFFRFEEGEGAVIINGVRTPVKNGSAVVVPSGARHNVINTSKTRDLKLYTLYSPPEHPDKLIRKTKQDAMKAEERTGENMMTVREKIASRQ